MGKNKTVTDKQKCVSISPSVVEIHAAGWGLPCPVPVPDQELGQETDHSFILAHSNGPFRMNMCCCLVLRNGFYTSRCCL